MPTKLYPNQLVQLAIESTGRNGSIAVMRGEQVLRQANLDPSRRTAATLAPAIEETLAWCRGRDFRPHFLVVADGPGSFTGLRIGVTTAKVLAYALKLPVVGVDSIAAIAAAVFHTSPACQSVLVGINAYRQQVYAGRLQRSTLLPPLDSIADSWSPHPPSVGLLSDLQWQETLANSECDLAGDAKPLGEFTTRPMERECDAVGVGLLGLRAATRGQFVGAMELLPRYLKQSAAEEKASF